jgi:hypothetical protein
MRHLMLATAAILSLATAEAALAQQPQAKLPELAATGRAQPETDARATNYALNGLPQQNTNGQSTQLAAGGGAHPQADTNRQSTQLAAGGGAHPQADTNEHSTQLAQGWHPPSQDNRSSTNV